jgi:hypothetical protein
MVEDARKFSFMESMTWSHGGIDASGIEFLYVEL